MLSSVDSLPPSVNAELNQGQILDRRCLQSIAASAGKPCRVHDKNAPLCSTFVHTYIHRKESLVNYTIVVQAYDVRWYSRKYVIYVYVMCHDATCICKSFFCTWVHWCICHTCVCTHVCTPWCEKIKVTLTMGGRSGRSLRTTDSTRSFSSTTCTLPDRNRTTGFELIVRLNHLATAFSISN